MGKNIIEINGRRYDAGTGQPLGATPSATQPSRSKARHSVDGILKSSAAQPAKASSSAKPATATPKAVPKTTRTPKTIDGRHPQPPRTLMRQAVTKPDVSKHSVKASGPLALSKGSSAAVSPKSSAYRLDVGRLRRAQATARHQLVNHFGAPGRPAAQLSATARPSKPLNPSPSPAAAFTQAASATVTAASERAKSTAEMLQRALDQATAHEQSPFKKSNRGKWLWGLGILLIILLVVGWLVSSNLTNIKLHLAAHKAGFSADVPSYRPVGYRLDQVSSSIGQIELDFQSSNHFYSITEKASPWDSDTLHDSYVVDLGTPYQAVETAGRTLYMYGHNDATWVSSGIWYTIQTNSLDDQQLIQLASST